jgi:hypothetical protein
MCFDADRLCTDRVGAGDQQVDGSGRTTTSDRTVVEDGVTPPARSAHRGA